MRGPEDEATKQGNLLRDKGDFDGAIVAYTEAICRNPQNAQPYSSRGQAFLRKGEFDKAIADCNKAIQLDPMTGQFTLAFTLGHTIFGQTDAALDITRDHEMVHVRQFERWGPLMGPAYLGCCLVLWLMRRRPYWDNPFEREAYGESDSDE